jgi:hypothetical protein
MPKTDAVSRRQFSLFLASAPWALADSANHLSAEKVEEFLSKAKVVSFRNLGVGITGTRKLTLSDGSLTHDAHFQSINSAQSSFQSNRGTELNFRDSYKFNIAGYRLDRMLGLNMTPPSIERSHSGSTGAYTWWIPGGLMEVDRVRRKIVPPDVDLFNAQMHQLRVFDQLIFNTDRNLQNLLLTPDSKVWLIDHTRAFRINDDLKSAKDLEKCEKNLFAALKKLDSAGLKQTMDNYIRGTEISALLKRRDKIVTLFEKRAASRSAAEVFYELPPRAAEYPIETPGTPWPE